MARTCSPPCKPIAIGILIAAAQLPPERVHEYEYEYEFEFAGELVLTGELSPIR